LLLSDPGLFNSLIRLAYGLLKRIIRENSRYYGSGSSCYSSDKG